MVVAVVFVVVVLAVVFVVVIVVVWLSFFHIHLFISPFSTTKEWDLIHHSKLGIKHLKTNLAHSLPDENGFIILVLRTHKLFMN